MTMSATKALAITLSEPSGFMTMYRYHNAMCETNVARYALEQVGKRPSRAREAALERLNLACGREAAYRDSMACMVIAASGYKVSRHQAVRAMNEESDALGEACWLAPIGKVRLIAMVSKLCSILNN